MSRPEKVEFAGSQGALLAARLDHPVGQPRAWALFAHCFTCSKDLAAASRVARALAERGFGVLRFDFTGLGHSEGEFASTNFSSNVQDVVRAADWLRERHEAPALLVGHSLGGAAVLAAAVSIDEASAVATIGAPAEPAHVARLFHGAREQIEQRGEATVELAGRSFTIRKQFLDDLEQQQLAERIGRMRKALLVLHSAVDQTVGIDSASEIFAAAKHPKSFVSLDKADHLLTRREDAAYVAEVIAAWASRYLPPTEETEPAVEPGEVLVRDAPSGRYTQLVQAGPHRLIADEPPSVGGDDAGPTPYGLLLASLGACTSMTLRMYADRKQLPLERVRVRLAHDKVHAQDCERCETESGRVDRIEREIELEGELTPVQRQRLLEIADRCPVHRTLHSEVLIETRLID